MKTMRYFGMAALAWMGAMMAGCSGNDEFSDDALQPGLKNNNTITLTTTVSFDEGSTRALTDGGVKTFAVGDKIAVIYKNTSNETVKAVSDAVTTSGSSATITVTLTNPASGSAVRYIYPAAMAKATIATDATIDDAGTVNYAALAAQDGTLATLASNLDLSTFDGSLSGTDLPASASLVNKLAVCKFTLIDSDNGNADITNTVTSLNISDGTNTYTVTPSALATIYVAMKPVASGNVTFTAFTNTKAYKKTATGKTLAVNNLYPISVSISPVPPFSVSNTKQVYFSPGNLQATYNGSAWSWAFAANQWDYIGNAEGNTKVSGTTPFVSGYSGSSTTVDLFGWSTSATTLGINNSTSNIYTGDFADWGSNATVQDGIGTGWRTLTSDEWTYLLNTRSITNRYCKATVNSKAGMVIFPDSYTHPSGPAAIASANTADAAFTTNSWSADDWAKMEAAGAVFLPAAGYRGGTLVSSVGSYGRYWSSTPDGTNRAYLQSFRANDVNPAYSDYRSGGRSVRLVRDAN